MRTRLLLIVLLTVCLGPLLASPMALASVTQAALVKDIWPGELGSSPDDLTNLNGTLYFSADDGTHGDELWKTSPRIR